MASSAFRSIVRIQTPPRYDPATGSVAAGELFGFDSAKPASRDPRDPANALLSIKTSKRLDQPCGRFTLTFAPLEVADGLFWSDILPAYSLVEIFLQRYPDPEPRLVMIGLVDRGEVVEDFSAAAPQRQVTVHGREAGCIFVDQKVLYLPAPPEPILAGQVAHEARQLDLPALYEEKTQLLGMLALDPDIGFEGASPVDVIDRFIRMATVGLPTKYNPHGVPLLDLRLPKRTLADLVVFDADRARAQLFDPAAKLPAAGQDIRTGVSLWEMIETWSDPTYHEIWTRTAVLGSGRLDGVIEVVFRRRPFAGRIVDGEAVYIAPVAGSQFDPEFLDDPAENIELEPARIISRSRGWDAARTQNLYYVYPQLPFKDDQYQALYQPLIDVGDDSPSDIRRLGLRLRKVTDYYFGEGPSTALEVGQARARLLWAWHRFEGIMQSGALQVIGDPIYEVGKRLVEVEDGDPLREAYITGVSHAVMLATAQPAFRTHLQFERGWPLR